MSTSPAPSLHTDTIVTEGSRCTETVTSQTGITSPSQSPRCYRINSDMAIPNLHGPKAALENSENGTLEACGSLIYGGIYKQDDVVGQYLARRDAQRAIMEGLQAPASHYINEHAGCTIQGHQSGQSCDSYAYGYAQRWYPDPENIRHLHSLHSLLPHISPERKLNALSGLEIDMIDGNTSQVFCRAVPKKMLVLYLGREVVSKFIRTVRREDNEAWRGLPTEQKLALPPQVTSAAAIKILVSWMVRACKFAAMRSMKPLRIPNNLFVACSLAQTLELFSLHRDAYRLDVAISQQFLKRPIYLIEVETLWNCLGENDRYVYGCIRALGKRMSNPKVAEELQVLAERYPNLYAGLCDPELNEMYRPQFGKDWFAKLRRNDGEYLQAERSEVEIPSTTAPSRPPLIRPPGGPQTSGMHTQGVRPMNPSAPVFRPASVRG